MSIDDGLLGLAGRYQAAPQWLKLAAGGLYSAIPARYRHGPSYHRFLEVFSSESVCQDYLDRQLRQTISQAIDGVPAYSSYRHLLKERAADPRTLLAELPLVSKEDIKRRLVDHVNAKFPERARLRMFTGGLTSIPMAFYVQRGVSRAKEWAAFRAMGMRFGTEGQGIVLALRGRTVSTAGSGRVWAYEPVKRHLVVSSDHLEPRFMPEYVAALRRWRPCHIHAFASALFPLLVWLRENGHGDLLSGVRSVVLTSESVFEHHMKAFQAFFDCPVMVTYGHSERVLLGNTLPTDTRYHFWPQYGHLELIGADGHPVGNAGEVGEIVGTSFDNHVMPFVRYRTGDYAALGASPHPSAAGFAVLERIDGRLQEFVVCRDHRLVTVTTLGAAHFDQLERCLRIQYQQSVPGELILRVVALEPLGERAHRQIERAIREKTQGGCDVKVIEVDQIPPTERGKQRLLVQDLDVSHYLGAAIQNVASSIGEGAAAMATPRLQATPRTLAFASGKAVLMLGTDPSTQGGIAAVIKTYRSGGLFDRVAIDLVATHQDGSRWQKANRYFSAVLSAMGKMVNGRAVLVHAHVSSGASFWRKSLLLSLAHALRIPTVFHLHSGSFAAWASEATGPARLRRWWIKRTLQRCEVVIVLTDGWARWMSGFAPKAKVTVVGNPVIVPGRLPPDEGRGSNQGCGTVLYLGWIYDFKGVYDLLHAWVLFRARCPGWRLVVGGKGEAEKFLAEARHLGVSDDLDFLGWVSGDEKERELCKADIVVLPSYNEGMPVSVLEGMAYGAAIATTAVGGVPDMMVEGVHGLWMRPGDISGIADTLARLAESPELRRRLAQAAYLHVAAHHSVEASVRPLLDTYSSLAYRPASRE